MLSFSSLTRASLENGRRQKREEEEENFQHLLILVTLGEIKPTLLVAAVFLDLEIC